LIQNNVTYLLFSWWQAAAAFVVINDDFVMVDVVFFCVIFEVGDNFITTKKKDLF
jgi:hypothetical protein